MPLSLTERSAIFQLLVTALQKCCPPMVESKSTKDAFEIIGNKPVPYGSTKKIIPGMYFASAVARKDMVSFYLFPLYSDAVYFEGVAPSLEKCLKGKTCYNFKKTSEVDVKELDKLLKKAVQLWKKAGYLA
jgi:hypothetical protein